MNVQLKDENPESLLQKRGQKTNLLILCSEGAASLNQLATWQELQELLETGAVSSHSEDP